MKTLPFTVLLAVVGTASAAPIPITEMQRSTPVEFAKEVYPMLKESCLACHNATKAKANLNLESPDLILKGGDGGPAVVPGKSANSLLLKSAAHQDEDLLMPPPGNKAKALALTSEQLGVLKLWIDQGAKGQGVADAKGPLPWRAGATSGPVQAASISPDGRLAAIARANRVTLGELGTGRTLSELGDPELAKQGPWKDQKVADRDAVMSMAFGADDLLATGGFRTVRLWRRQPRSTQRSFGVLPEIATTLAVSGDQKWAAAGDSKGVVWLWSMAAEKFEPTALKQHAAPITALAFSPDGSALVTTSEDKNVRVWNVAEKALILEGSSPAVIRSLTTANGKELLAACGDGFVRVWIWPTLKPEGLPAPVREFKLQDSPIQAMTVISGDAFLWAAVDGTLRIAGMSDGAERRKITPEHPEARRVAWLESELQLTQRLAATRKAQVAAAVEDSKKKANTAQQAVVNLEKSRTDVRQKQENANAAADALKALPEDKPLQDIAKKAADTAAAAEGTQRAAKVNADLGVRQSVEAAGIQASAEIAVAAADAAVVETQAALDAAKKHVAEPAQPIRQLVAQPDGAVAIDDAEGNLRHVSLESGELLEPVDRAGIVAAINGTLLCISADKQVRLTTSRRMWTLERVIGDPDDPAQLSDRVMAVAFSPDGKLLATGGGIPSRDGELKLWRVSDGTLVRQITKAHTDSINSVAFSPDGEMLASAAGDRFARIWKVVDGSRVANLEGHTGHVLSVAWRGDGLLLATGGADRSVRLWDAATYRQVKAMTNFNAEVAGVSFVGAGEQLLVASGDKSIRLGDQPLPDFSTFPFCAVSDATGKYVAAGGQDGVLRVWSVADRKLNRSFASAER